MKTATSVTSSVVVRGLVRGSSQPAWASVSFRTIDSLSRYCQGRGEWVVVRFIGDETAAWLIAPNGECLEAREVSVNKASR